MLRCGYIVIMYFNSVFYCEKQQEEEHFIQGYIRPCSAKVIVDALRKHLFTELRKIFAKK